MSIDEGKHTAADGSMKVLLISCVFPPEPVVSAQTSLQIARELSTRGNHVRVICPFPNRPAGRVYPGYFRKLFCQDPCEAGFNVLRCFSSFSTHSTMISRSLENISFGITSGIALLTCSAPDVIYVNTWPILAQVIIGLICQIRRIPLVLSVQDVYPESLLAQNRIRRKSKWIYKFLRMIDTRITRNCAALIVISEQFKRLYLRDRNLSSEKVHVVPNWIDEKESVLDRPSSSIRTQYGIPQDAFLVVYGGNIGKAAGMDRVVQAFADMLEYKEIYLLIAGDGSNFDSCKELAQSSRNDRILFHRPWLADETSRILSAADLCILPTQGEQSRVSVPSKLLSYMLASRPVLALALRDSDVARIITDSACGWVISPGDSEELAEQIIKISQLSRDSLRRRGVAGRNFARRHFSKSANLPKIIEILEKASNNGRNNTGHDAR